MEPAVGTAGGTMVSEHNRRGINYASSPGSVAEGTLVDLFLQAVDEFDKPDAMLYREGEAWRAISHREVLDQVRYLAQALVAGGIRRGDRVALLSENRPEWALTDWATGRNGH
jgi:long-chain acyl-CoA synthetase